MAQLPGGQWLMQQVDGEVILFHRDTQEELIRFNPSDADSIAMVQAVIYELPQLNEEQKCFAHFWSGYFYAYANIL